MNIREFRANMAQELDRVSECECIRFSRGGDREYLVVRIEGEKIYVPEELEVRRLNSKND